LLKIFCTRTSLEDVDMVAPTVLVIPDVAGLALGDVFVVGGVVLAMAVEELVALLIAEHPHEGALGVEQVLSLTDVDLLD